MNRIPIEWVKNPDGTQGFSSNPIEGICKGERRQFWRTFINSRVYRQAIELSLRKKRQ